MTKVLVADDDRGAALLVQRTLERWGLDVVVAADGADAWDCLDRDPGIGLGILDWTMPGIEGPDLCRRIRASDRHEHLYVLLLTHRDSRRDLVTGLDSGANDYLVKPFHPEELRARVHVGLRVVALQDSLRERATELHTVTTNVTQLRRLLPICSYCKDVRSDDDYWQQLEDYVSEHTDLDFTHGICPGCYEKAVARLGVR